MYKTKVFLLGPQASKSKLSDYVGTLAGLSVTSRAVKDHGEIIDSSLSFETRKLGQPFFILKILLSKKI